MSQSQIATFVVFDIETTGLPWQEKNQTKITEFSLIAVNRKDIESSSFGETPPVSKLTFVVNPMRPINAEVTQLTGLTNAMLRYAPIFSQKIKSIISFLEDLPKPVCLVAHNGNTFDFKILLAEFKDANASLPVDLLCVDSLHGFRKILKDKNIDYTVLATNTNINSISDDLLTDDEDEWPDLNASAEDWEEIDDICLSLSDISCEDIEETEQKQKEKNKVNKARRKAVDNVFNKCNNKVSYALPALYKRLLNKKDCNAHRAEVDCIMLLQCIVALKNDFLPWADTACKRLTEIKPLVRY